MYFLKQLLLYNILIKLLNKQLNTEPPSAAEDLALPSGNRLFLFVTKNRLSELARS